MTRRRLAVALGAAPALALALALCACGGGGAPSSAAHAAQLRPVPAGTCGAARRPPATYDHVVVIVMENHSLSDLVDSSDAPYVRSLARRCGLASRYFAVAHPSLPNYIALTSGSTQGIADDADPAEHRLAAASIFSQLRGGGWRSLEESMPSRCDRTSAGEYAVKHNPAAYYTALRDCASYDLPLGRTPELTARFTLVTPNLIDDMHDGTIAQGDAWLAGFVPKVLASRQYRAGRTILYITWDEDDGSQGNQVATLVIGPSVRPGARPAARFDHYSLLATIEQQLGLRRLGAAATARSMRAAFGI